MGKKLHRSGTEEIPTFREHSFTCPYCGKLTTVSDIRFMSFVEHCKFKYFAAQMTTHEAA